MSFYRTKEWMKARSKCLVRDGYQCRSCGTPIRGKGMAHVDHIQKRRERPDLALDLDNLQSLCSHCHNSLKQIAEKNDHKESIDLNGYPPGWA